MQPLQLVGIICSYNKLPTLFRTSRLFLWLSSSENKWASSLNISSLVLQWNSTPQKKLTAHCTVIITVWLATIQCIALLVANNLQSGLSSASSVASSTLRLWYDRSLFIVVNQEVWGRPAGLFQSLGGTAVRIILASADSNQPNLNLSTTYIRRKSPLSDNMIQTKIKMQSLQTKPTSRNSTKSRQKMVKKTWHTFVKIAKIKAISRQQKFSWFAKTHGFQLQKMYILGKIHTTMSSRSHIMPVSNKSTQIL